MTHVMPDRFEKFAGIVADGYRRYWVLCSHCGSCTNVLETSNAARLAVLSHRYYEVEFASTTIQDNYARVMALPEECSDNAARVARVSGRLDQWLSVVAKDIKIMKVLDIGAGTGVFLAKLLQVRFDMPGRLQAVALEPDPIAAAHLRSIGGFDVVENVFNCYSVGTGYGLVTLNKVLEHVSTPAHWLSEVARVIDPSMGLIYVEVPDVATIGNRPPTDNILGALHHHLYSPHGLAALFDSCCLQILELRRIVEPSGKITVYGFACHMKAFKHYTIGGDPGKYENHC